NIQIFLRFIGFYKYFIILYSKIIIPLTELLKGNKRRIFKLLEEAERVFIELKRLF
ncbi:hypothetical protein NEUTE2DRAFT_60178, partial [Neurospora tetrasperma FGSC 2509]